MNAVIMSFDPNELEAECDLREKAMKRIRAVESARQGLSKSVRNS